MAEVTITTNLSALQKVFTRMKNVFYLSTANQALSAITTFDMEFPVLEDGITFDTGAPQVETVKLTEGRTWISRSNPGEPDISLRVASVAGAINELFMSNKAASATMSKTINNVTYSGKGYSFAPKKVTGALFMTADDGSAAIYLPNVEMFASFVGDDSNGSGHYNVVVTPLADTNGAAFYPLEGATAGG